jgi:hypothetical protein
VFETPCLCVFVHLSMLNKVRRPAQYYRHLLDRELAPLSVADDRVRPLLLQGDGDAGDATVPARQLLPCGEGIAFVHMVSSLPCHWIHSRVGSAYVHRAGSTVVTAAAGSADTAIGTAPADAPMPPLPLPSSLVSQLVVLREDAATYDPSMPAGALDVNGQQLDLRTRNSWLLKLGGVACAGSPWTCCQAPLVQSRL